MRVTENCAECLYSRQRNISDDAGYLAEVKEIIENRGENDTSPYLVYLFNRCYERRFGKKAPYGEIKKRYNSLVLSMEDSLRARIEASEDPLRASLVYARAGNYIDFGAMNTVDEETFVSLLENACASGNDDAVIDSFIGCCAKAKSFLLIADNCGEIVLDRLFLEQLKNRFPALELTVMVRGGEILNDAVTEDALQAGIDRIAKIISNGAPVAGTIYSMLPEEAKRALDCSGVILAKGQGNYESLCGQGRHIFYSFLCKCELFTERFGVPRLTGIFTEENGG